MIHDSPTASSTNTFSFTVFHFAKHFIERKSKKIIQNDNVTAAEDLMVCAHYELTDMMATNSCSGSINSNQITVMIRYCAFAHHVKILLFRFWKILHLSSPINHT